MYIFSMHLIVQHQLSQFANSSFLLLLSPSLLSANLSLDEKKKKNFFTGYKVIVENIKSIVQNVPFWLSVDLTFIWFFVSYLMQYHSTTLHISRCPELRRTDHQQKAVLASMLCMVRCLLSWVSFWLSHRLALGLGFVNIPKDPC